MAQVIIYPSSETIIGTIAQLPASLGQKASAASLPVVIASDQSAVTVAGTVTANAGTGTMAVSAASLPLPAGAATAAKQPAIGTAGVASADVISVQGIASGTPIPISGSITATNASVGATGAATPASASLSGGSDGVNLRALKVSATGVLSVDGSAAVQPSSQSGVWTVQPGNTANTTPWLTTISQAGNTAIVTAGGGLTVAGSGTFTTDQVALTTAVFQAEGNILGSSLTGVYATAFTAGGAMKIIQLRNSCNQIVVVSLDGGVTNHYFLEAGDQVSIDLKSAGVNIPSTTAIQAKHNGVVPTSGSIRVNGVR